MTQGNKKENQRAGSGPRRGFRVTYGASLAGAVIASLALWWVLWEIWKSVQGLYQ